MAVWSLVMAQLGDEEWRAHAELIGRVTIAWNHCVYQLLRVFRHDWLAA